GEGARIGSPSEGRLVDRDPRSIDDARLGIAPVAIRIGCRFVAFARERPLRLRAKPLPLPLAELLRFEPGDADPGIRAPSVRIFESVDAEVERLGRQAPGELQPARPVVLSASLGEFAADPVRARCPLKNVAGFHVVRAGDLYAAPDRDHPGRARAAARTGRLRLLGGLPGARFDLPILALAKLPVVSEGSRAPRAERDEFEPRTRRDESSERDDERNGQPGAAHAAVSPPRESRSRRRSSARSAEPAGTARRSDIRR